MVKKIYSFDTPADMLLYKTCLVKNNPPEKIFLSFMFYFVLCFFFCCKIACSGFSACNVVSMFKRGLYTVKNYGLKRNCSVSIIYPERIQLLSVDVGVTGHFRQQEEEIGIRSKVKNKTKTHGNASSDSRTLRTYIRTMAFELLISKDMYTNIFFSILIV